MQCSVQQIKGKYKHNTPRMPSKHSEQIQVGMLIPCLHWLKSIVFHGWKHDSRSGRCTMKDDISRDYRADIVTIITQTRKSKIKCSVDRSNPAWRHMVNKGLCVQCKHRTVLSDCMSLWRCVFLCIGSSCTLAPLSCKIKLSPFWQNTGFSEEIRHSCDCSDVLVDVMFAFLTSQSQTCIITFFYKGQ